jgi:hypothetical protein
MPKKCLSSNIEKFNVPINRNYCRPAYSPSKTFGMKTNLDPRGTLVKNCVTYHNVIEGTNMKKPVNTALATYQDENCSRLGIAITPNNNITCVPDGFAFGKFRPPTYITDCMTTCEVNPNRNKFKKCHAHLNTLRKFLSKRFESIFFKKLYLALRHFDVNETGWIDKETVYKYCKDKFIEIIPEYMEPLLCMWNAFDGSSIEYKTLVNVINYTLVLPEMPKVWDIPEDCLDFRTTYKEMIKAGQEVDKRGMAGLPSGRYIDLDYPVISIRCTKADRSYLPQETDAMACLCPSILTLLGLSHRDMYTKREPDTIRKVFEAAGTQFNDNNFQHIWDNAEKFHSRGWVCYETLRRSMNELKSTEKGI